MRFALLQDHDDEDDDDELNTEQHKRVGSTIFQPQFSLSS